MAPEEKKISGPTPLVPPNANVVYKEGPSEQLPQFGLRRDESLSPLMSFQTAPASTTYVRSTSPILSHPPTPPFGAIYTTQPPSPISGPFQPTSPALAPFQVTSLSAPQPPPPPASSTIISSGPKSTPLMTSTPPMGPFTPVNAPSQAAGGTPPSRYSSALEVQRMGTHSNIDVTPNGDNEVINIVEQIVYQPVVVEVEKYVEVPEIQYREVPVQKTVEVPEVVEQVVLKEIPVPQYVEIEVPEYVEKTKVVNIDRIKPVGVESITSITYEVPAIETEYEIIPVPIYVPQFIEVPVPVEQMDEETQAQLESLANDIAVLTSGQYPSLSVLEDLFERSNHVNPYLETDPKKMLDHWKYIAERGGMKTIPQPSPPSNESQFSQ